MRYRVRFKGALGQAICAADLLRPRACPQRRSDSLQVAEHVFERGSLAFTPKVSFQDPLHELCGFAGPKQAKLAFYPPTPWSPEVFLGPPRDIGEGRFAWLRQHICQVLRVT